MALKGTLITFAVPATATTGTAVGVHHLMPAYSIQFGGFTSGTFSIATAQIMGSNDGNTFVQIGSDVTTNGIVSITTPVQFLRIDLSVHTSGTQTAVLKGYDVGWSI
jgi:hypothetical protein